MVTGGNSAVGTLQTLIRAFLKANDDIETIEQWDVMGAIAIHVGDLLISGSGIFVKYIPKRTMGKFEADSYGGETKRPIWVWGSQNQTIRSLAALLLIRIITKKNQSYWNFSRTDETTQRTVNGR